MSAPVASSVVGPPALTDDEAIFDFDEFRAAMRNAARSSSTMAEFSDRARDLAQRFVTHDDALDESLENLAVHVRHLARVVTFPVQRPLFNIENVILWSRTVDEYTVLVTLWVMTFLKRVEEYRLAKQ